MKRLLITLLLLTSFLAKGQTNYHNLYTNAKDLLRQGKYNLAMESFKPLIPYDRNNPYSAYASFYYALAAYKQGYRTLAKDQLNSIKTTYAKWDKIDEVNFWIGKIHFDDKDFFQGLKVFSAINDKSYEADIRNVKLVGLKGVTDLETLRMMHEEYSQDPVIAKYFAAALSTSKSPEDQRLLENLVSKFRLRREDFVVDAPKSFKKDRYSVSLLFPFRVSALDPSPAKKPNQLLLDFYEGMKLAVDTLATQDINIDLRVYDTERNLDRVKRLLGTEELRTTDLVIGPFFPEENKLAQEFSKANKVNIVNPFSTNPDVIADNPYGFMFQTSSETLGAKSAEFIAARATRKNTMVFYGSAKKDSLSAVSFVTRAKELGLNIVYAEEIPSRDAQKILEILVTPTEYDEFKYPSQFTLKKDSIGSIYVASDDALIYAKIVTSVERRADSIRVVGSENWLDDTAVDPEKYQTLNMTLTAPNFTDTNKSAFDLFLHSFIRRYGRTPSQFSKMGYEMMLLFGNQLGKNGVFFQEALMSTGYFPGYLYEGYNYNQSRSNLVVPFVTLRDGKLTLIEKR